MKKTIIALMAMAGVAASAEVTWTGDGADSTWGTAANWSTNAVPISGDTIIINDGSSVTWNGVAGGVKYSEDTIWKITNGSTLTLGTKGVNTDGVLDNPRFDGQFYIDETSSVTTHASFLKGTNEIYGKLIINNVFAPATDSVTLNFGETGVVQFAEGSRNGIEGNGRTFTLGAILNTGSIEEGASYSYTLEKRYLIAGDSGNDFSTTLWQSLTLVGGSFTSVADGNALVSATTLTATEDDFGKYLLNNDAGGVYVQYVKANLVPEPTTATLSLLALAGLAARRRRK